MRYETVETEIDVSELRIGMHVIKLDRPWEETDFLLQGFIIQRQDDIDALQSQCRKVTIEGKVKNPEYEPQPSEHLKRKEKARFIQHSQRPDSKKKATAKRPFPPGSGEGRITKRVTYINKVDVNYEIRNATGHYGEAKKVADGIMSGLRVGRALDL